MANDGLKEIISEKLGQKQTELILFDETYFDALIKDINRASTSINLEVYIFKNDIIGREVASALVQAAKRGVKVRILVDGIGTGLKSSGMINFLKKEGTEVRMYHPLPWMFKEWVFTHSSASFISKGMYLFFRINKRNHRKTCVIDNEIVYAGSANIAQCHLKKENGGENWHDINVRLIDVDTKELNYAFEKAWNRFPMYERAKIILRKINKNPIFRLNYSWRLRRALYKDILLRIKKSKKRIWISNAYFVPDAFLLRKLIRAANRGVDVRILLPEKSDVFIYPLISAVFYERLLRAGISIYEYLPSVLHAKMLIIDDTYFVGSSNLNYRSIRHDLEVDVHIRNSEAKKILENQFIYDLTQSVKINSETIRMHSWLKKIVGRILLFIQYWL